MTEYICLTLADADATPLHLPVGTFAFWSVKNTFWKRPINSNKTVYSCVHYSGRTYAVREKENEIKKLLGITK